MSTLTPEEIDKLAENFTTRYYGDDCCWDEVDVQGFAAAIEAALRAKWFAEPAAYLSTDPKLWGGSRIKPQGTFTVPVFAAPQENT
jgi:hypothetical protein